MMKAKATVFPANPRTFAAAVDVAAGTTFNRNRTLPNRKRHAAALAAVFALGAQAAEIIKPQVGEPLRDAAVTRAPDGTFYLTGTRCMARRWAVKPDCFDNPY